MTNALIIALALSCIPACHAITAAHRAGARGWLAYTVWLVEEAGERLLRLGGWLRDFNAWRESRKALRAQGAGNWSPAAGGSLLNSGAAMGTTSPVAAVPGKR